MASQERIGIYNIWFSARSFRIEVSMYGNSEHLQAAHLQRIRTDSSLDIMNYDH